MRYNVRNKRNDDGTYTLSYGSGSKKLTSVMAEGPDGWGILFGENVGQHKRMRDCKEAWGQWAEVNYGVKPAAVPPSAPPPVKRKSSAPPSIKKKSAPIPDSIDYEFAADPFDPRYKYPPDHDDPDKQNKLTPIGVLVEIDAWGKRHQDELGHALPKTSPLFPLLKSVKDCLNREIEITPIEEYDDVIDD